MQFRQKARLMNCLHTILELESEIRRIRKTETIILELSSLRSVMCELDLNQLRINEDDVVRIEMATKAFLRELEVHFENRVDKLPDHELLH